MHRFSDLLGFDDLQNQFLQLNFNHSNLEVNSDKHDQGPTKNQSKKKKNKKLNVNKVDKASSKLG